MKTKKQAKKAERGIKELVKPDEKRKREEQEFDTSASAAREREVLREEEERRKSSTGFSARVRRSMGKGLPMRGHE